ncbi:MAG: hypothetical protein LBE36_08410 [Flavobacteriaceae bacterium]|jgi:hypothetical protein|nr:hypothetical protein [Flavobacteriaceae bacterium]
MEEKQNIKVWGNRHCYYLMICLLVSCNTSKNDTGLQENNKQKKENRIIYQPDSTINNVLYLQDYTSTDRFYNKSELKSEIWIRESPIVIFSNKSKKEYLIAYQYEGGTKNSFECFEIGYFVDDMKLESLYVYHTDYESIKTESSLGLGSSFEEIINKKGISYTEKQIGDDLLIEYQINDMNTPFLQRYNMPGYFEKFYLRDNKTYKIIFGFEYP